LLEPDAHNSLQKPSQLKIDKAVTRQDEQDGCDQISEGGQAGGHLIASS
jgi:hypothetical protein